MLVRRLLALLVAVGLVLAAVQVRARLFGEATPAVTDDLRVVCLSELDAACDALDLSPAPIVEDAAATVERMTGRDPRVDVWVTVAPWPQIAADARAEAGLPELPVVVSDVVARSPVLIAIDGERLEVLEPACDDGELTWVCIGAEAGRPWTDLGGNAGWGRVEVGIDRPETSAVGLLTLSQATSSFFDGEQWNTRSLESPAYFSWLAGLAEAADASAGLTPLERMLLTGTAEYEMTGALESSAAQLLSSAGGSATGIVTRRPPPEVTADVVVAAYGDAGGAEATVSEQLRGPLTDSGWRVDGAPTPSEAPAAPLPAGNGLPSAPSLEALRQLWIEVARA